MHRLPVRLPANVQICCQFCLVPPKENARVCLRRNPDGSTTPIPGPEAERLGQQTQQAALQMIGGAQQAVQQVRCAVAVHWRQYPAGSRG